MSLQQTLERVHIIRRKPLPSTTPPVADPIPSPDIQDADDSVIDESLLGLESYIIKATHLADDKLFDFDHETASIPASLHSRPISTPTLSPTKQHFESKNPQSRHTLVTPYYQGPPFMPAPVPQLDPRLPYHLRNPPRPTKKMSTHVTPAQGTIRPLSIQGYLHAPYWHNHPKVPFVVKLRTTLPDSKKIARAMAAAPFRRMTLSQTPDQVFDNGIFIRVKETSIITFNCRKLLSKAHLCKDPIKVMECGCNNEDLPGFWIKQSYGWRCRHGHHFMDKFGRMYVFKSNSFEGLKFFFEDGEFYWKIDDWKTWT